MDDHLDLWLRRQPILDIQPFYASTMYFGRKDHPLASWCVQDKVLDSQNPSAGTATVLTDEEKRTRIEVTFGPQGCREIGLTEFRALETFRFTKLQRRFFRFMLPTVGSAFLRMPAVREQMMLYRRQRFFAAGVLGVQIMEQAGEEIRQANLPNIRRLHRQAGTKMPAGRRHGKASSGTLVAFAAMNRVVEETLRHLQERMWKQMEE
jgi:hypothetical protein